MVQFTCDILSEKRFLDENILKFKQNNIKISSLLLMSAMAEDIKEVNFNAPYMKIKNFKVEADYFMSVIPVVSILNNAIDLAIKTLISYRIIGRTIR